MNFTQSLQSRAAALGRTIVLPESDDDRVLTAAAIIRERGIGLVIPDNPKIAHRVLIAKGETGGEAFYPKKVEQLPAVYARIAELLRSQYLLWYPSDPSKPVEQFRQIRVEVSGEDLEVRTIRGYYPGK